jgi:RNA polymerase sigma factor for flagellar operon FliA
MSKLVHELWVHYRRHRDEATRLLLLDQYLGLVHRAARDLAKQVPHGLDLEELVSAGTVGLVQALESFEPERGLAFSTFAVPRIRGAILDDLRRWEWAPRSAREHRKELDRCRADLERRLQRRAEDHEVAADLGIDLDTYQVWLQDAKGPVMVSLDDPSPTHEGSMLRLHETIADPAAPEPGGNRQAGEDLVQLHDAFLELPAKDQLIISLYYFEHLTLKQIGSMLRITESRVCQIHNRTLKRLRARINAAREVA